MSMRSLLGCVAVGVTALSFGSSASATLIVHEPFDYNVGAQSLNSENGGIGYTAAYSSTSNGDIKAGSFNYTDTNGNALVTSGNRVYLDSTTVGVPKPPTAPAGERVSVAPNRAITSLSAGGSTIFVSFLAQQVAGDFRDVSVSLFAAPNANFSTEERLSIGHGNPTAADPDGDLHWGAYALAVGDQGDYSDVLASQLSLIVVRVDVNVAGTADSFKVYVNPTLGVEPAVADAERSDLNFLESLGEINRVRMRAGGSNDTLGASQMDVDEIRIGTTYADVTPIAVPEPASAFAGLIGAALLMARRRSR